MKSIVTVRLGGLALIVGALAFMAVFAFLAARFDYPAVLDGQASSVLPALLATGSAGRAAWALYGFLPLIWLPAGVGTYYALRDSHPGAMLLAFGMFRNLTTAVAPVAAINNYLLPLWMIALGIVLLRHRKPPIAAAEGVEGDRD